MTRPITRRPVRMLSVLAGAALLLAPAAAAADGRCADLSCAIGKRAWAHIDARHCRTCDSLTPKNSEFAGAYCGGADEALELCRAVLAAADCTASTQRNGRIAATATLDRVAGKQRRGCTDTRRATVILEKDGRTVVTQFPGDP